jgi:hypothetical protein
VTDLPFVGGSRAALRSLIDYAGLLPPGALTMAEATKHYREARDGPHGFVLGRFEVEAGRLETLAGELTATMRAGARAWPLSVLLDGNLATAVSLAQSFTGHVGTAARIEMTDVRAPRVVADGRPVEQAAELLQSIVTAATAADPFAPAFVELPIVDGWEVGLRHAVAAVAEVAPGGGRVGASLRTGDADAASLASVEQVAVFIVACTEVGLPYKIAAGPTRAMRHHDSRLDATRHGFLNLLAAAALADAGAGRDVVEAVLAETDGAELRLTASSLRWRRHRVGVGALKTMRATRLISIAGADVEQSVADLLALGMLEPQ